MTPRDERHPIELLSAWVDEEVSPDERAAVEAHLRECESCRDLAEDLRALSRAIGAEEAPPIPDGLPARVAWRIRSSEAAEHRRRSRPRWLTAVPLTAAATIAAVGLLVSVYFQMLQQDRAPAPPLGAPLRTERPEEPRPLPKGARSTEGPRLPAAPPEPARRTAPKAAAPDEEVKRSVPSGMGGGGAALPELAAPEGPTNVLGPAADAMLAQEAGAPAARVYAGEKAARIAAVPAAELSRAFAEKTAKPCAIVWDSPVDAIVMPRGDGTDGLEVDLPALATRLGGGATAAGASPRHGWWIVQVPSSRWNELVTALVEFGADAPSLAASPPAGTDCARITVRARP